MIGNYQDLSGTRALLVQTRALGDDRNLTTSEQEGEREEQGKAGKQKVRIRIRILL